MAPKLQEVADELERRESLRFSLVPHDETKFRVWKFGAMRDIKAKLMTIKYRDGMETAVEAYIAALQNSQTMEIHKDLAAMDAGIGSALAKTIKGHPKQDEIEEALANDDIESGLGTLKKIESKILTGSIVSQQGAALRDLLDLEYKNREGFTSFLEQFKGLILKSGHGEDDQFFIQLMTQKISKDSIFSAGIVAFNTLNADQQTKDELIKILVGIVDNLKVQKNANAKPSQSAHAQAMYAEQQQGKSGTLATLYDKDGNEVQAYVVAQPKGSAKAKGRGGADCCRGCGSEAKDILKISLHPRP